MSERRILRLKPGASTYRGTAELVAEQRETYLVRKPDGSLWTWPKEWTEDA